MCCVFVPQIRPKLGHWDGFEIQDGLIHLSQGLPEMQCVDAFICEYNLIESTTDTFSNSTLNINPQSPQFYHINNIAPIF